MVYPDVKLLVEEKGDFFRAELRLDTPDVTEHVTRLVSIIGTQPANRAASGSWPDSS